MKSVLFIFLCLSLLSLVFGFFLYQQKEPQSSLHDMASEHKVRSIPEEKKLWRERIKKIGGEKAYVEFKQTYLSEYPTDIHYITHLYGEALYEQEGIDSVAVCDSNFAYGCYMGFSISAIKDKGLDVVSKLNDVCIQKNGSNETGCRHGIGHGLIMYLGNNNLEKALEICNDLHKGIPLGCMQGTFMEYNKPAMMNHATTYLKVRPLENDNKLHEPCASIKQKFQITCYYEQAQWWNSVLNHDYKRIGVLCSNLSQGDLKKACYMGIGTSVSQNTGYDTYSTISACNMMPTIEGQVACRSTAAWVFKINPNYTKMAPELCKGLDKINESICLNDSVSPDLIFNQNNFNDIKSL